LILLEQSTYFRYFYFWRVLMYYYLFLFRVRLRRGWRGGFPYN